MPKPLNVLFITADQWRGECLSARGHMVRTPNLDALAADGVLFTRHYANTAPCGPSRACLHTGLYLQNHRSGTNGTPLDRRHPNWASESLKLGYDPVLFGYTDTSVDPRTVAPGDPRLATYEGVLPGLRPLVHLPEGAPDAWLDWLRAQGAPLDAEGGWSSGRWRAYVDRPVGGAPGSGDDEWGAHRAPTHYPVEWGQTAFLTDRILDYVAGEQAEGRPWFVHASYLRPHPPFFAPEPYNTMYDPTSVPPPVRAASAAEEGATHPLLARMVEHPFLAAPANPRHLQQLRATYFGMQSEVDTQLGRILDWLDVSGAAADTVVVVTSDHGEQLGDHYLLHKLGFFDESFHVPLLVRDPRARFDAMRGSIVDEFTEHVDVMPTILDLLDLAVPSACDGRSLVGLAAPWRDEVHWEYDFREPADRSLERRFGVTMEQCALTVLRDAHGKYVHFSGYPALPPVFFDLDDDPDELHNRAGDPAYAVTVLDYAQRMLAWQGRHRDRTLASMKLTPSGIFEHTAARR